MANLRDIASITPEDLVARDEMEFVHDVHTVQAKLRRTKPFMSTYCTSQTSHGPMSARVSACAS